MTPEQKTHYLSLLNRSEDPWIERKQSYNEKELRRTIVGFANSVGEGQTAVLFIGADNNGNHKGVADADQAQRDISRLLQRCYPPIKFQIFDVIHEAASGAVSIIAVVVPFSSDRPHFVGPAYIRRGSETVEASREVFLDLIASQNDRARRIIQFKNQQIRLQIRSPKGFFYEIEAIVESCDAHTAIFKDHSGVLRSFSLNSLEITSSALSVVVVVPSPVTEEQHIREIIWRSIGVMNRLENNNYPLGTHWVPEQLLANPLLALPAATELANRNKAEWFRLLVLHLRFALKGQKSSLPYGQKARLLETRFNQKMTGQSISSKSNVIGAITAAVGEFATSLEEADELVRHLIQRFEAVRQIGYDIIWNALMWQLNL
jgi:hypothetical protein